ncbi:uncharacterized protein LOC130893214 [Diorhabda carinulata]|uniref:uncharacterized protein LOC130893214 n=1 Tax=Diorhabda carinulata TaxID=1163345 RepID=UPI0025A213CF|nr:uncharacterized protein LOC130893214 [Diorhabda carinulata]
MAFSDCEKEQAKNFVDFYIDKIENQRNYFRYYLSEDVILDWFGQTVKGEKNVNAFLNKTITSVNHILSETVPATKIGSRESHVIKPLKTQKSIPLGLLSPPRTIQPRTETKTPKKQPIASTSHFNNNNNRELRSKHSRDHGQGDGYHKDTEILSSPVKKLKTLDVTDVVVENLEMLESESDSTQSSQKIKYVVSEGCVEFHKPSLKKYQSETRWRRPCKLSIAYTSTNCNDYTIYLIIYEGNVKCRRNLMKDFEAAESER